jgi:hypothetical protein
MTIKELTILSISPLVIEYNPFPDKNEDERHYSIRIDDLTLNTEEDNFKNPNIIGYGKTLEDAENHLIQQLRGEKVRVKYGGASFCVPKSLEHSFTIESKQLSS